MQKQRLNQQQKLTIGTLQIQFLNLLQIPIADLNKRIEEELEKNPALEESINTDVEYPENEPNIKNRIIKDYSGKQLTEKEESLSDFLHNQLIGVRLEQKKIFLINYLIDSLDDTGFLTRDLHSISSDLLTNNINVSENELNDSLMFLQKLEPTGVGARNLQECLLIQLDKKEGAESINLAKKILKEHYTTFSNKNFEKLITKLGITDKELKSAYTEVEKLNPFPGNGFAKQNSVFRFINADFIIKTEGGKLLMKMGVSSEKKLNISPYYERMLEETNDQEAKKFLIEKIEGAKWFKQAINDRFQTLEKVMTAILSLQEAYFKSGDHNDILPMKLADIAQIVKMDISTISRVSNSKYVETDFGTFLLKELFSEAYRKDNGEIISTKLIKNTLQELINNEDKSTPLTDEQLANLLGAEEYHIARRTVAKYREGLNIPIAKLRRKL